MYSSFSVTNIVSFDSDDLTVERSVNISRITQPSTLLSPLEMLTFCKRWSSKCSDGIFICFFDTKGPGWSSTALRPRGINSCWCFRKRKRRKQNGRKFHNLNDNCSLRIMIYQRFRGDHHLAKFIQICQNQTKFTLLNCRSLYNLIQKCKIDTKKPKNVSKHSWR